MILRRLKRRPKPGHCAFLRFAGEFPWNAGPSTPVREIFDAFLAKSPGAALREKIADFRLVLSLNVMYRFIPIADHAALFCTPRPNCFGWTPKF
jgi:hypothetical protein